VRTPAVEAPWFFRKRFTLFGAVYGVSILAGYVAAGALGVTPQAVFLTPGYAGLLATLAILLAVGGYALRVWASSYLAASIVWQQDVQAGELRVSGPYRFTRNPLYLGNMLQALGIGMLFPWTATLLLFVLMCAYEVALVSVEEAFLAAQNGEAYRRYREAVARFVPLPWKVAPDGAQRGSLREGLRSEVMCAGFAVMTAAIVAFALVRHAHP
jgi:protein-S-isoprenylcysteine O-methyltransferase Ste14